MVDSSSYVLKKTGPHQTTETKRGVKVLVKSPPKELISKGVVLVFGWLGAKESLLSKYADIYTSVGIICVLINPPISFVIRKGLDVDFDGYSNLLEDLGAFIKPFDLPLFIHVFSNAFAYEAISQLYARSRSFSPSSSSSSPATTTVTNTNTSFSAFPIQSIRGTIFDSAPVNLTRTGVREALNDIYGSTGGYLLYNAFSYLDWLGQFQFSTSSNSDTLSSSISVSAGKDFFRRSDSFARNMLDDPMPFPQLYLYSLTGDRVADSDFISRVVRYRRKTTNVFINTFQFENSKHVAHFRSHPREYQGAIHRFVDWCLHRNDNANPGEKSQSHSKHHANATVKLRSQL